MLTQSNPPSPADAITPAVMRTPREDQESTRVESVVRESDEGSRAGSCCPTLMVPTLPENPALAGNFDIFGDTGTADVTEGIGSLFDPMPMAGSPGGTSIAAAESPCVSEITPKFDNFPSARPGIIERFTNQDESLLEQGYDSEGNLPYFDPTSLEEDPDTFVEQSIGNGPPPAAPAAATAAPPRTISIEDVDKMKGKEVKAELRKRGQGVSGNVGPLKERLKEAIRNNIPVQAEAAERHESMTGLDVTARWVLLEPDPTPIPEPTNDDGTLRPPTERDAPVNKKYGYREKFSRTPFQGTTADMTYIAKGRRSQTRKRYSRKRKRSFTSQVGTDKSSEAGKRIMGGPSSAFLRRYNLDENSHPADFWSALMPLTPKDNKEDTIKANVKGDRKTKFAVSNWTSYTNAKANLVNAGEEGHIFAGRYTPFTNLDINQILGTYIIDGVAPSPQLLQKMQPQTKQRSHGNDFIASCLGRGFQQKYYSFRHFFGCQDPLTSPPRKEECPNFKVDEFFRWLRYIIKEAWHVGENFSIDEQTCKMQGRSEYKTRCGKFKRIGDGIQADCIADDGYTVDFYFRNEPVDQKWLSMGLSPMHARLMHMYSNLREVGHKNKMDNLFNSVNLAQPAFSLPQKVQVHGVIRRSGRGVNPIVFQEEVTGKKADERRGTVKAAVLKGDSKSCDLVIASCFDQKPFYMISHSIPEITWVECTKKIWSTALQKSVDFKFLRWNLSDDYNFEMNDNDVADQLRLCYRIQRFQRNFKWWWSLWIWGIEISIVNAYMIYRRYCELKEVPQLINHHDFREKLGYALLDPDNEWPRRKSPKKTLASLNKSKKKIRHITIAPKINTKGLDPQTGRLKRRLDFSLGHFPTVPVAQKRHRVCQLHRWAFGEGGGAKNTIPPGARKDVYACDTCGVKLCIPCFSLYHQCEDLPSKIDDILDDEY